MSRSLPPPLYNSLALRWQKLLCGCASLGPARSEAETWGEEESQIISGAVFPRPTLHFLALSLQYKGRSYTEYNIYSTYLFLLFSHFSVWLLNSGHYKIVRVTHWSLQLEAEQHRDTLTAGSDMSAGED